MLMLILLPVYMESNETEQADVIGIEANDDMYGIQEMYFYKIDAIRPITKDKCIVYSSGLEFIIALGADQVRNIISQSIEINNSEKGDGLYEYYLN